MKRRDLLKYFSVTPALGGLVGGLFPSFRATAAPKAIAGTNLFKELGIRPIVNARGTMTYLSGSLMMPEVMEAINATSHDFANMHEVMDKVGEKIAELLHCEGAMVTSGAASALVVGTAACITGMDEEKMKQLPNMPGPKKEVIIQKSHRYVFDQAVATAGIKFVEVEGPEEMENAINENTVMALFFNGAVSWYGIPDSISHEQFIEVAKKHKVPTFIDAAADVPPAENLYKYQKMGFDLVTFSGGKMIRGPQSAGLLFGRKDLIEAAKRNYSPYESPIGRPMKVNKEEIFGMYVALKTYLEKDHAKEWDEWVGRTKKIASKVNGIESVKSEMHVDEGPANAFPGLNITWDQSKVKISPKEAAEALSSGNPRIEIGTGDKELRVSVVTLRSDQVDIVGQRIKEVLEHAIA